MQQELITRYGPPEWVFRFVYTRSRTGYRVERWNRAAGKWAYAGLRGAMDRANTLKRHRLAVWAEPANAR